VRRRRKRRSRRRKRRRRRRKRTPLDGLRTGSTSCPQSVSQPDPLMSCFSGMLIQNTPVSLSLSLSLSLSSR